MSRSNHIKAIKDKDKHEVSINNQESDCPILPTPEALKEYQKIDSNLVDWFQKKTEEEACFRRSFMKKHLYLLFLANLLGQLITGSALIAAIVLALKDQYIGATAAGSLGGLALVLSLLNKNKQQQE